MGKYRVHIECSRTVKSTNSVYSQCIAYVMGGATEGIAQAKALEMAKRHYVEYDSFRVYHTEKLQKGETDA